MQRSKLARLLSLLGCLVVMTLCGCRNHEAAAPAAHAPASTTITALIWAPDWSEQMLQLASDFSRQNPDVRVDVQFMIGNSVEENIKPRIASGNLPDILSINPNAYAAHLAEQGVLVDVSATTAWKNMLEPLKVDWTSRDARHFGIAGGMATTMIYYNRAMFERAGIRKLPTNFTDFLAVCAQLKHAGFTPVMWNGGFPNMLANGPFSSGFAANVVTRNPDWKEKIGQGTLNLDTPQVADIFAKIRLLPARGYVQSGFMSTGYDEGIRLFRDGKVAMVLHGSWAAGLLMNGDPFQVGVFVPPWNAPGTPEVPVVGSETGFAVTDTPNRAAALRFLEYISGPGFAVIQAKRGNLSPMKQKSGALAANATIAAYADEVSRYPVTGSPYYTMLPSNSIDHVHRLIQDVLVDKITPAEAARLLDESVKNDAAQNDK